MLGAFHHTASGIGHGDQKIPCRLGGIMVCISTVLPQHLNLCIGFRTSNVPTRPDSHFQKWLRARPPANGLMSIDDLQLVSGALFFIADLDL